MKRHYATQETNDSGPHAPFGCRLCCEKTFLLCWREGIDGRLGARMKWRRWWPTIWSCFRS